MNDEKEALDLVNDTDFPSYEGELYLQTTRNWLMIVGIVLLAFGAFFLASTLYALTGYFKFNYIWLIMVIIECIPLVMGGILVAKSRLISSYLIHSELSILERFFSLNRLYWLIMCIIIGASIMMNVIALSRITSSSSRFDYFQF